MTQPLPSTDIWRPGQVVERPLAALRPSPGNARTHSAAQLRKLGSSIRAFGFTSPVLLDAADRIVAGHGRVAAARDLGMATVPTVRLDHLTPAQCRALALADNRIAELAGWDRDLLRIEFDALADLDDSLDLSLTGFDIAGIDIAGIEPGAKATAAPATTSPGPAADAAPAVSRPGDRWRLGRHVLLCADAAAAPPQLAPPGAEPAAMLFTAPPEPGPGLCRALAAAVAASRPGALHYLCGDWRGLGGLAAATQGLYAAQLDLCVWDRGAPNCGARDRRPGPVSPYRPQHALVAVYRTPGAEDARPPEERPREARPGHRGRKRTNLWRHAADAPPAAGGGPRSAAPHPEMPLALPLGLIADAIRDATRPGDLVLDPFGGDGGTLLAAERTGRRARLLEADPRRVDLAVRRWQAATGAAATLAGPGDDPGDDPGGGFDAVGRQRNGETGHAA